MTAVCMSLTTEYFDPIANLGEVGDEDGVQHKIADEVGPTGCCKSPHAEARERNEAEAGCKARAKNQDCLQPNICD